MNKSILLIITLIVSGNTHSQSFLSEFDNTDVVFYGEAHSSQQHLDPILSSLEEGIKSGKINTYATEYVPYDLNIDFQNFLNSPTAIPGSKEELNFLGKISERLMWPDSARNRAFYQSLRELKLKYKDKIKFCGIDFMPTREQEESEEFRLKAYTKLPKKLQDKVEQLSGKSMQELSKDTDEWYREAHMGNNISNCYDSKNRKGIVHVGAFHAHSLKSKYADNDWWTASKYFNLLSDRNLKTLYNLVTYLPSDPEEIEGDKFSKALIQIGCLRKNYAPEVIAQEVLPSNIKEILTITFENDNQNNQTIELYKVWDTYILGPLNSEVIWDNN